MTDSLYSEVRLVCAEHWDLNGCRNCPLMEAFDEELNDGPMCKLFGPPGCWPDENKIAELLGYKRLTLWERFLIFIGVEIED